MDFEFEPVDAYRGMNPAFVRSVWAKRRLVQPSEEEEPAKIVPANDRQKAAEEFRVGKLRSQMQAGGVKAIIAEIALSRGFTYEDIVGKSRHKPIVAARHAAVIEVAIQRPAMSLSAIARSFNRDHTTILAVLQKHTVPGRVTAGHEEQ